MGCCVERQVTDFVRVNSKKELIQAFEQEINRLDKMLKHSQLELEKEDEAKKKQILEKIIDEDVKLLTILVHRCNDSHIMKIKFLLCDYFQCTETWKMEDLNKEMNKIICFYNENEQSFENATET